MDALFKILESGIATRDKISKKGTLKTDSLNLLDKIVPQWRTNI